MDTLYGACRALYEGAFPGAAREWDDALFRHVMPDCLRVICEGEKPVSMLFSIPYPIKTEKGVVEARYLYAVATDPAYRGRGLAKRLLREVIAEGLPVFLRPSSDALFEFYRRVGLSPLSPVRGEQGNAARECAGEGICHFSETAYLAERERFLELPFAVPAPEFLKLGFALGGAVGLDGLFVAFYERRGEEIYFKEWLGDTRFAPRATAFLGGATYRLRTPDACGKPFAMAAGCPEALKFLIALD